MSVRSGFSLKRNCYFHTSEGKNTCGHLGRKNTGKEEVPFRHPGGFVMLPEAKANKTLKLYSESMEQFHEAFND